MRLNTPSSNPVAASRSSRRRKATRARDWNRLGGLRDAGLGTPSHGRGGILALITWCTRSSSRQAQETIMTRTSTAPSPGAFQDIEEYATRSPEHEFEQHHEGPVATAIERQTARLPSDTFLWAAGASIAGSLVLQMMNRK